MLIKIWKSENFKIHAYKEAHKVHKYHFNIVYYYWETIFSIYQSKSMNSFIIFQKIFLDITFFIIPRNIYYGRFYKLELLVMIILGVYV